MAKDKAKREAKKARKLMHKALQALPFEVPDEMMQEVMATGKVSGMFDPATGKITPVSQAQAEAIKAEAAKQQEPVITWEKWLECMRIGGVAGWALGKMALRDFGQNVASFYVGNLKGDFGVFTAPMQVCYAEEDGEPTANLAALMHLPTGVVLCLFETRDLACHAADLIIGRWEAGKPLDYHTYHRERDAVYEVWRFNDIAPSPRWHAHPAWASGHEQDILAKVEQPRPEKLT